MDALKCDQKALCTYLTDNIKKALALRLCLIMWLGHLMASILTYVIGKNICSLDAKTVVV